MLHALLLPFAEDVHLLPQTITAGTPIILSALAIFGFWVRAKFTKLYGVAQEANGRAETAVRQTTNTGNGYASRTEEALQRIEAHLRRQDLSLGGIRDDLRQTTKRLDHTVERLDHHLTNPTTRKKAKP